MYPLSLTLMAFSIKDLHTQTVKLLCASSGDLYPLQLPLHHALTTSSSTPVELWHQQLAHPDTTSFSQVLAFFDFKCNKSAPHHYHSCKVGKHGRLPFHDSVRQTYFPFQLVHTDVWTSPSNSGYKYYVVFLDDFTHHV
jgi:hypothetical protein